MALLILGALGLLISSGSAGSGGGESPETDLIAAQLDASGEREASGDAAAGTKRKSRRAKDVAPRPADAPSQRNRVELAKAQSVNQLCLAAFAGGALEVDRGRFRTDPAAANALGEALFGLGEELESDQLLGEGDRLVEAVNTAAAAGRMVASRDGEGAQALLSAVAQLRAVAIREGYPACGSLQLRLKGESRG